MPRDPLVAEAMIGQSWPLQIKVRGVTAESSRGAVARVWLLQIDGKPQTSLQYAPGKLVNLLTTNDVQTFKNFHFIHRASESLQVVSTFFFYFK